MSEIAEMVMDGNLCRSCGVYIEGANNEQRACLHCLNDELNLTYVTFGSDHKHIINGNIIDFHCIAVIKCHDADEGRKIAFEMFGTQFCLEYYYEDKTFDMKYYPRGFIIVN